MTLTLATIWCQDCGKQFVHYLRGIPQSICGYCAGEDVGGEE